MLFVISQEFFLHLLTVMERENRKRGQMDHAFSSLQFKVEDRLECGASKQVIDLFYLYFAKQRYNIFDNFLISFPLY